MLYRCRTYARHCRRLHYRIRMSQVFGKIDMHLSDQEKQHALELLSAKYNPGYEQRAIKYIAGSFARTFVLRLDIEHLSGKTKKINHK